jgi:hypothetical protein
MAIKLHKSRKHNSKKHNSKKHNSKKHNSRKHYTKKTKKNNNSRRYKKSNSKSKSRARKMQRGGFADCNLASVKEPAFNVSALGNVPGLSITESRGAIYRPNCKPDIYQAMTP